MLTKHLIATFAGHLKDSAWEHLLKKACTNMIEGNTVASLAFAVQIHMLESSDYASTANMSHANASDWSNLGAGSI